MDPRTLLAAVCGTLQFIFSLVCRLFEPLYGIVKFMSDHQRNYSSQEMQILIDINGSYIRVWYIFSMAVFVFVAVNLRKANTNGYKKGSTMCVFFWIAWMIMQNVSVFQWNSKFEDSRAYNRVACLNSFTQAVVQKTLCVSQKALIGHLYFTQQCAMLSTVFMTILFYVYHSEAKYSHTTFPLCAALYFVFWFFHCHDVFFVLTN